MIFNLINLRHPVQKYFRNKPFDQFKVDYFLFLCIRIHISLCGQELIGDKNAFYEVKYEINTLSGVT